MVGENILIMIFREIEMHTYIAIVPISYFEFSRHYFEFKSFHLPGRPRRPCTVCRSQTHRPNSTVVTSAVDFFGILVNSRRSKFEDYSITMYANLAIHLFPQMEHLLQ